MQSCRAELHVHTVLSPCASVEMIPPLIVETALEQEITLIAITDHNASANVPAVQQAARGTALTVLPGMEVQTQEDTHLLCLFQELEALQAWQIIVDESLPDQENRPDFFGDQYVVDATGDYLYSDHRLLINSIALSFDECVAAVHDLGGLAIPAHVNRQAFGLFANLGMIPPGVPIDAIEISRHITPAQALAQYPEIQGFPLIQSGDVHFLEDFLGNIYFTIEAPTLAELRLALRNELGRKVEIRPKEDQK
jgi:hypothetical protein